VGGKENWGKTRDSKRELKIEKINTVGGPRPIKETEKTQGNGQLEQEKLGKKYVDAYLKMGGDEIRKRTKPEEDKRR